MLSAALQRVRLGWGDSVPSMMAGPTQLVVLQMVDPAEPDGLLLWYSRWS